MQRIKKETKVETVLGKVLTEPIPVVYEFDQYDSPQEARDAGDWPNDKEVLSYVNSKQERNALSAARQEATAEEADKVRNTREYRQAQWKANTLKAMPNIDSAVLEAMAEQIQ